MQLAQIVVAGDLCQIEGQGELLAFAGGEQFGFFESYQFPRRLSKQSLRCLCIDLHDLLAAGISRIGHCAADSKGSFLVFLLNIADFKACVA